MKNLYRKTVLTSTSLFYFMYATIAHASITSSGAFKTFKSKSGYKNSDGDLVAVVGSVVSTLLGLMGILFAILLIYGGVYWMTSSGDSSRADYAKKIIRNSVIGLIISFSAYAISSFVLKVVLDASQK